MKKIFITSVMMLGALFLGNTQVSAFSGEGDGLSAETAYIITTCLQLQEMNDNLGAYYKLGNDINCGAGAPDGNDTRTWNGNPDEWVDGTVGGELIPEDYDSVVNNGYFGFEPIGNGVDQFTGTFDGDGKTISNLWIFRKNESNIGIFGYTATGATITNVTITNAAVVGGNQTGILVGSADQTTISGITINTSMVRAYRSYYGGSIAGLVNNSDITDITVNGGTAHGSGNVIGGIIGFMNNSELSYATTSANVDGGYELGGAVGTADDSYIHHVQSTGNVHSKANYDFEKWTENIGGFIGYAYNTTIEDSSASGTVTITNDINSGVDSIGGFVGYYENEKDGFEGGIVRSTSSGAIIINAPDNYYIEDIGGFAGYVYTYNDTYTYFENNTSSSSISILDRSGIGYVEQIAGFVGTFENYGTGGSFISENQSSGDITITFATPRQNDWEGTIYTIGGFAGYLYDGNGSSLDVLNNQSSSSISITAIDHGINEIGGFAGYVDYGVTIGESLATGDIIITQSSGGEYYGWITNIGGFIGEAYSGIEINDAKATGNITITGGYSMEYIGGFLGEAEYEVNLSDTKSEGNIAITANNYSNDEAIYIQSIGGHTGILCSDDYYCEINRSYATGNISIIQGSVPGDTVIVQHIGGFVGNIYYSDIYITQSFTRSNIDILFSTANGNIEDIGGFIGYNDGSNNSIYDTYAKNDITINAPNMTVYDLGGFLGQFAEDGVVVNSYSVGDITITANTLDVVGGFSGNIYGNSIILGNFRSGNLIITAESTNYVNGFNGYFDEPSSDFVNNYLYHGEETSPELRLCGESIPSEDGCFEVESDTQFYDIDNQPYIGTSYGESYEQWSIVADEPGEAVWFITSSLNGNYPCLYWQGGQCGLEPRSADGEIITPPAPVYGCMNPSATNYNPSATVSNGSCTFPQSTPSRSWGSSGGMGTPWGVGLLVATAQNTNTPSSDTPTSKNNACPSDQLLTQNLRSGARNGRYHAFTKGIVREVRILQAHMNRLGFNAGPVDGILGPKTDAAIKRMQQSLGTPADGLVGPKTRALINNSCA